MGKRFIPAWAGNSWGCRDSHPPRPVHPRVGGEQQAQWEQLLKFAGSSPRGRGTGRQVDLVGIEFRFIPAWAGNRRVVTRGFTRHTVHPRVGGEQSSDTVPPICADGSSPRGRGTVARLDPAPRLDRFIPAWAGNRPLRPGLSPGSSVHPRVGGEQWAPRGVPFLPLGSSPRGRGTGPCQPVVDPAGRFIPAWAGNSGYRGLERVAVHAIQDSRCGRFVIQ